MKVKLGDIVKSSGVINTVMNSNMKAVTAFKFQKVFKFIQDEFDTFNKLKEKIVNKYGLITNEMGGLDVPVGSEGEVNAEFEELLDIDSDFNIDVFVEDFEEVSISPAELDVLFWMIKEKGAE